MNKQKELDQLRIEIVHCEICRRAGSGEMVFGEGDPNAKIMFIGEAPGKQEAKTGRPFIGRSGQLLRKTIREIGLREEDVYITSPVKYLPHKGTPTQNEIKHSHTHFQKQLDIINPTFLVLLGKTAAFTITGKNIPTLKEHGEIFQLNNWTVIPTIHPAAVLRFPKYKQILLEDFEKVKSMV